MEKKKVSPFEYAIARAAFENGANIDIENIEPYTEHERAEAIKAKFTALASQIRIADDKKNPGA